MNSSIAVIVAVCGMMLVLLGLFLLLVLQIVHFGKRNALMSIVQFMGGRGEDAEEDRYTPLPDYKVPSSIDLQAKAESLDFDAAVQKYRDQGLSSQSVRPTAAPPLSASAQSLRPGNLTPSNPPSKPLAGPSLSTPSSSSTPSTPPPLGPLTPGKLSDRLSANQNTRTPSNPDRRSLRRMREDEDEDIMGGLISGDDPEALL
jgi:hypothetical protein